MLDIQVLSTFQTGWKDLFPGFFEMADGRLLKVKIHFFSPDKNESETH